MHGPVGLALRGLLKVVRWALLAVAWLSVLVGVFASLEQAFRAGQIDLADRCPRGETGKCFSRYDGVVLREPDFWGDPRVRFDDARRTESADLLDEDVVSPGDRVRVEIWNGEIVALYDEHRERRFRTVEWPQVGNPVYVSCLVFGLVLLALVHARRLGRAVVAGSRHLARRRPRRRPGTANRNVHA